jgi:hypothetical protein
VKGTGPTVYWVENGVRRPLDQSEGVRATRISQIELKNWPVGDPIPSAEWNAKQAALMVAASPEEPLAEGELALTPDGKLHQHRGGRLHRIVSAWASEAWSLNRYRVRTLTESEAAGYAPGLPIIAPPVVKADNI